MSHRTTHAARQHRRRHARHARRPRRVGAATLRRHLAAAEVVLTLTHVSAASSSTQWLLLVPPGLVPDQLLGSALTFRPGRLRPHRPADPQWVHYAGRPIVPCLRLPLPAARAAVRHATTHGTPVVPLDTLGADSNT